MVETVDTPALAGARRGDCLVEAIVKFSLYFVLFDQDFEDPLPRLKIR